MNPVIKLEIEKEINKFEGSMLHYTTLESKREALYLLYAALAVREIDFHLLKQKDNGWYLGERFIGKTIDQAYWEVVKWV